MAKRQKTDQHSSSLSPEISQKTKTETSAVLWVCFVQWKCSALVSCEMLICAAYWGEKLTEHSLRDGSDGDEQNKR